MSETPRAQDELLARLPDVPEPMIPAQPMRDFLVSRMGVYFDAWDEGEQVLAAGEHYIEFTDILANSGGFSTSGSNRVYFPQEGNYFVVISMSVTVDAGAGNTGTGEISPGMPLAEGGRGFGFARDAARDQHIPVCWVGLVNSLKHPELGMRIVIPAGVSSVWNPRITVWRTH